RRPRPRATAWRAGAPSPTWGCSPGVETNAMFGGAVDNNLSVSLGVARTGRLDGVALALGGNWASHPVRGIQLAIGGNVAREDVTGAQFSVGGNLATGAVGGMQATVGLNIARQGGLAGQLAVGGNFSGAPLDGAQLSVGSNWVHGDFGGYQGTVGVNMVQGRMAGVQMSVGMNWAASAQGVQLSLLNVGATSRAYSWASSTSRIRSTACSSASSTWRRSLSPACRWAC
ncbi:hypothetical protein ACLESD_44830, partial [Pyxidicoccus sp. 3LFB2]